MTATPAAISKKLRALGKLADEIERHKERQDERLEQRDAMIRELAEAGIPKKDLAAVARVSKMRVSQIDRLDRRSA